MEEVIFTVNDTLFFSEKVLVNNLNIGDTIVPISTQHVLERITTLDLIIISKHILHGNVLTEDWQLKAADANEDGIISALDVVYLRGLILREINNLPSGKSRVFDPPFVVYDGSFSGFQFESVKIGNLNAIQENCNQNAMVETFISGSFSLKTFTQEFEANELITVPITPQSYVENIIGIQFPIRFTPDMFEFVSIRGNETYDITNENFSFSKLEDGFILFSWNANEGINFSTQKPFIVLTLKSKIDGEISSALSNIGITSSQIKDRIFLEEENGDFEFQNVTLFHEDPIIYKHSVFPNPFVSKIYFQVAIPKRSSVELFIYDASGKYITSRDYDNIEGNIMIEFSEDQFPSPGVYFYTLKTNHKTWNGKIIAH